VLVAESHELLEGGDEGGGGVGVDVHMRGLGFGFWVIARGDMETVVIARSDTR
jgi:hypothetical protein